MEDHKQKKCNCNNTSEDCNCVGDKKSSSCKKSSCSCGDNVIQKPKPELMKLLNLDII